MSSGFSIKRINSIAEAAQEWQHLCGADEVFETDPSCFRTMLMACTGEHAVACVTLYDNPGIQKDGKKTLVFGNLYFPDDTEIFKSLFAACDEYSRSEGYEYLLGPINGNTWNSYRLPLDNFGAKFLTDLRHPGYYQDYLSQSGCILTEEYSSSLSEVYPGTIDPKLLDQLKDEGVEIRNISIDNYDSELEKIFHFCQEVFSKNVHFSPISKDAFVSKYLSIRRFIDPDLVTIAENKEGELKAIYFVLPDVMTPKRLVIKTIARAPGEEIKGIMMVMSQQLYNKAHEKGYRDIVHAFMHSSNRSVNLSRRFSGKTFKSYGLFSKELNE